MKRWNNIDLCYRKISQCVIVSQINYLPQPLASQIIFPSDQISRCFAYSLVTSDKIHQSSRSKTPTNFDTPSCIVFMAYFMFMFKCSEPSKVSVTSRLKAKPWFFKIYHDDLFFACSAGVLLGRVNLRKLAIVYSTSHVWFGVRVDGEGKGAGKAYFSLSHPLPSPSFRPSLTLLVQISFSPQPFTAVKI